MRRAAEKETRNSSSLLASLKAKQRELDALLALTRAVSINEPEISLYERSAKVFEDLLSVHKLVVYRREYQSWHCVFEAGIEDINPEILTFDEEWLGYQEPVVLQKSSFQHLKEHFELLLPISHKEKPLIFLLLGKPDNNTKLTKYIDFIQTLANVVLVAVENKYLFKKQILRERQKLEQQQALYYEMQVAEKVQKTLIPKTMPHSKAYTIEGIYLPHQNVGGDYYDVIPLNPKEVLLCIADVSGKGVGAAMMMSNFQAVLRAYVKDGGSLSNLVQKLNHNVFEITGGDSYITLFIAKYNASEHQLCYINAGHVPPLLVHQQQCDELDGGCTMLGVFEKLPFIQETVRNIPPSALLMLHTDGFTDMCGEPHDSLHTHEAIKELLLNCQLQNISDIKQTILSFIENHQFNNDAYSDDISVLVCKFL